MPYTAPLGLLSLTAITASGAGTAVDLGAAAAADITVAAQTITGGSVTVAIQTSVDGLLWTPASASVALSAFSVPGVQPTKLYNLERYVRATWTVAAPVGLALSVLGISKIVYATPTDLAQLGLPPTAYGVSTDTAIQLRALESATGEADAAIRMQGTLPLKSWGDDLRAKVAAIAALQLISRRGFNPEAGANEYALAAARDARGWLKQLAAGDIDAGLVDSSPTPGVDGGAILITSPSRGWGRLR